MESGILDNLAHGRTAQQIVRDYPPSKSEDVLAAIEYAAKLTREEDIVPLRASGK